MAHAQQKASATGRLDHFDQFLGSGIWDYGSRLGEDAGLPPVQSSPYISEYVGKKVIKNDYEIARYIHTCE